MLFQLPTSALILALAVLADASSHAGHGAHLANMRRRQLNPRGPQPVNVPDVPRASLNRRSCRKKATSSSATLNANPTQQLVGGAAADPATSKKASSPTTAAGSKSTTPASPPSNGGAVAAGNFKPVKPANWPTATQAGPQPTSTVASAHDPYLEELSKAIDNSGNHFFTDVHTGDMTYYGQGLGACGDVYDDNSFTAAVSMEMFDNWPGSTGQQNRAPICGPFVPGRQAINNAGLMVSTVKSSIGGFAQIGGDGLINCVGSGTGVSDHQCHIPLTATVTHGDKSIQVKIVDRCVGCAVDDIDLTPAAFAALADMSLGRTSVKWQFNAW
ncbi:DPBB-1 domain-containing protein [Favolaschia claudopus]|uniref:DPBB-1 domain-containing protein n=1 Tax=Favolaschia claudopus TaxID=2862362 RepID=A0AAW0DUD3_9AGAR